MQNVTVTIQKLSDEDLAEFCNELHDILLSMYDDGEIGEVVVSGS